MTHRGPRRSGRSSRPTPEHVARPANAFRIVDSLERPGAGRRLGLEGRPKFLLRVRRLSGRHVLWYIGPPSPPAEQPWTSWPGVGYRDAAGPPSPREDPAARGGSRPDPARPPSPATEDLEGERDLGQLPELRGPWRRPGPPRQVDNCKQIRRGEQHHRRRPGGDDLPRLPVADLEHRVAPVGVVDRPAQAYVTSAGGASGSRHRPLIAVRTACIMPTLRDKGSMADRLTGHPGGDDQGGEHGRHPVGRR